MITPSQTVGPYFLIGLCGERWEQRLPASDAAEIEIRGTVYDADSKPVVDAMLEIWQSDKRHFARVGTDPKLGTYSVRALQPSSLLDAEGRIHAPHINVGVFARGLLKRLHTRIYLPDDPLNIRDPVLTLVPWPRRATLIATPTSAERREWSFDIRLSGDNETVFFEC
jgi:protocatechuate 3,4-dioxygenase alpha subunit